MALRSLAIDWLPINLHDAVFNRKTPGKSGVFHFK